ncbi:MAG: cation diffusion facilitator family transporter, partial [Planctomycetes bacterium]|nr:cation diffusion facilitator family transporter [Planctomycetota bacterium]
LTSLLVFSMLLVLGLFICASSTIKLLGRSANVPGVWCLPIAAISVLANHLIYRYSLCAGGRLKRNGLVANAHQARADMLSSIAVVLGILLAQIGTGWAFFDPLAALFVGVVILRDASVHWMGNLRILLDDVPDPAYRQRLSAILRSESEEAEISEIVLRRIGEDFWIGVELRLPAEWSLTRLDAFTQVLSDRFRSHYAWIGEVEFFIAG